MSGATAGGENLRSASLQEHDGAAGGGQESPAPAGPTWQNRRISSSDAAHHRERFLVSGPSLRRSSATALSSSASQAKWCHPGLLRPRCRRSATALPPDGGPPRRGRSRRRRPRRRRSPSSPPAGSSTRGPHSGHAFGCAWKRRSVTRPRTRAGTRGTSQTAPWSWRRGRRARQCAIVKRGPQFVQLVKALAVAAIPPGSSTSAQASGQVAASAVTRAWTSLTPGAGGDDEAFPAARRDALPAEVLDQGGAGARPTPGGRGRAASPSGGPSTSIHTPCGVLDTVPARRRPLAKPCTKGRKPTPCTAPETRTRRAAAGEEGGESTRENLACCHFEDAAARRGSPQPPSRVSCVVWPRPTRRLIGGR